MRQPAPDYYRSVGAALTRRLMARHVPRLRHRSLALLADVSPGTVQRFLNTTAPIAPETVWAIEGALGLEHDLLMRVLAGETTLIAAMDMADGDLQKWILGQLEIAGAPAPDLTPGAWRKAAGYPF